MIQISKATYKEIKDFDEKEWHGVDNEHYGRPVEWKEKKFRFKAIEGRQLVGTVKGLYGGGIVCVDALMVASDKRGRGIGKALLAEVEKLGKKLGAHKIHLVTGKLWEANKFYLSLGFQKVADLPRHYFGIDFVAYDKYILSLKP